MFEMTDYEILFAQLADADATDLFVRWNIGIAAWNDERPLAEIVYEWETIPFAVQRGMASKSIVSQLRKVVGHWESFDAAVADLEGRGLPLSWNSARNVAYGRTDKPAKVDAKPQRWSAKRDASSTVAKLGADKARKLALAILAELDKS